jgi:hypothetical protein
VFCVKCLLWFKFLICDIFLCDRAICIVVSRFLVVFTVPMIKSCIQCFIDFPELDPNSSIIVYNLF